MSKDDREFSHWVLESVRSKKIQLKKLTWSEDLAPTLFDYQAFLPDQVEVVGSGSDFNENTAILKAVGELYERFMVRENGIKNSNGCAVHFDPKQAQQLAKQELIERDCFLFQYINKNLPNDILKHQTDFSDSIFHWSRQLFPKIQWRVSELKADPFFVYQSTVLLHPYGVIVGLGSGLQKNQALNKSIIECARNLAYLAKNKNFLIRDYNDLLNISFERWTYQEHGDLGLTKQYFDETLKSFQSSKKEDFFDHEKANFDFKIYSAPPEGLFKDVPLTFVQAESEELIPLICGMYTDETLKNTRVQDQLKGWNNPCLHVFR